MKALKYCRYDSCIKENLIDILTCKTLTERPHYHLHFYLHFNTKSHAKPRNKNVFIPMTVTLCACRSHIADGLVKIPHMNKLLGKIRLKSSMSESKIMDSIRSVFRKPVNDDPFSILSSSSIRVLGVSV